jgi:hypothetical protein
VQPDGRRWRLAWTKCATDLSGTHLGKSDVSVLTRSTNQCQSSIEKKAKASSIPSLNDWASADFRLSFRGDSDPSLTWLLWGSRCPPNEELSTVTTVGVWMLAKLCSEHKVANFYTHARCDWKCLPPKIADKKGGPLGGHTTQLTVATDRNRPKAVGGQASAKSVASTCYARSLRTLANPNQLAEVQDERDNPKNANCFLAGIHRRLCFQCISLGGIQFGNMADFGIVHNTYLGTPVHIDRNY